MLPARVAAISLVVSSGCSFIFVTGPPSQPPADRVAHCTTSAVPFVTDMGLTLIAALASTALVIVAYDENNDDENVERGLKVTGAGVVAIAGTGALALSAIHGYQATQHCQTYQLDAAARISGGRFAPQSR